PGSDDVDQVRAVGDFHLAGEVAHHPGRTGDLADGFLLDAQSGDDRRGHQHADLASHDLAHEIDHFVMEDLAVLDGALKGFLGGHGHGQEALERRGDHESRKFSSSAWPCSVRMDSGWNCTPWTGCSRWRRPMTSSKPPAASSVQAVTSRHSGTLSRATTSEW